MPVQPRKRLRTYLSCSDTRPIDTPKALLQLYYFCNPVLKLIENLQVVDVGFIGLIRIRS
jgi:hypothetical protein